MRHRCTAPNGLQGTRAPAANRHTTDSGEADSKQEYWVSDELRGSTRGMLPAATKQFEDIVDTQAAASSEEEGLHAVITDTTSLG